MDFKEVGWRELILKRVVFLHGFLGSARNWSTTIFKLNNILARQWNFLAVDLLWHGRAKEAKETRCSKGQFSDAMLARFEEDVGSEPFWAVAHSFGLRPLLSFAAKHPDQVQGIIVEDSCPRLSSEGYYLLSKILKETPVPFSTRDAAKSFFENAFLDPKIHRFLLSNITRNDAGDLDWRFDCEALSMLLEESRDVALWTEWSSFEGPIFLILGEHSKTVSKEALKRCREERRNAPLDIRVVNGAGHWIHFEKNDEFVAHLVSILG